MNSLIRAQAVKIKEYRIRASGVRGHVVSIPRTWLKDVGLDNGGTVIMYRDIDDNLILYPKEPLSTSNEVSK